MFTKIDALQEKLNSFRPLPKNTVKSLHEQLVLEWTYNSNAIEGNTLTLKETKVVLEGITIGGKSMREHFEAINHKEAIDYVEAIVSNDEPFTEHVIKSIHQLILKEIDSDNAGVYRKENVLIAGAEHTPPDHILLAEQMTALLKEYNEFKGHPLERAARLHIDFVKIHPFVDGNGRTARLLMNLDLMKTGLQPVVIKAADRLSYYEALDKAHTLDQFDDFLLLVSNAEEEALNKVLALVDSSGSANV
ncbi:MAG: Fic family protein [Thiotrichaceae bacterium]|nr:Fic family protein [Thiotrichaceae bacterium]